MRPVLLTLPCALLLTVACGSIALGDLASRGDWGALRSRLASEGALTKSELRALGRAVLERELNEARGVEGESFVGSLAECARELDAELERRAATPDDVGYAAAMVRLETGRGSLSEARDLADSPEPGALALFARSLLERVDGTRRREAFLHPETRVRRAALDAASIARDPDDREALLEVGRLDPDPLCRVRAFTALSLLGGEGLAARLQDRFTTAAEEERLAIVDVWASAGVFPLGGRERLAALAFGGPENGLVGLVAAERLTRFDGVDAKRAHAVLERGLLEGPLGERRFAVRHVSLQRPSGLNALLRTLELPNEELRIVAAARLLEDPSTRQRGLLILRGYENHPEELGRRARAALSVLGQPTPPVLLRQTLRDSDRQKRAAAGRALIRMGLATETAPLLADVDSEVRSNHACLVLARVR